MHEQDGAWERREMCWSFQVGVSAKVRRTHVTAIVVPVVIDLQIDILL
jgi:hypothetical protein